MARAQKRDLNATCGFMGLPLQDLAPILAAGWTFWGVRILYKIHPPTMRTHGHLNTGEARGKAAAIRSKSKGRYRERAGGNEGFRWEAAAAYFR